MAIHDDNWTKEMETVYKLPKKDRIIAGVIAALLLLAVTLPFFPQLYVLLEVPLTVALVGASAAGIYYFLRLAIRGR